MFIFVKFVILTNTKNLKIRNMCKKLTIYILSFFFVVVFYVFNERHERSQLPLCYYSIKTLMMILRKIDVSRNSRQHREVWDHTIPKEGLPDNEPLAVIIASKIYDINLGEAHEKAKKDCESFESLVKRLDLILDDPSFEMFEEISGMKNEVDLKREELKFRIDQNADKLVNKLDNYLEKFNAQLKNEQFQKNFNDLEEKKKSATRKLNDLKSRCNLAILDETLWKNTSCEIANELRELIERLTDFKKSLDIQSDLDDLKYDVEFFKNSPFDQNSIPNKLT